MSPLERITTLLVRLRSRCLWLAGLKLALALLAGFLTTLAGATLGEMLTGHTALMQVALALLALALLGLLVLRFKRSLSRWYGLDRFALWVQGRDGRFQDTLITAVELGPTLGGQDERAFSQELLGQVMVQANEELERVHPHRVASFRSLARPAVLFVATLALLTGACLLSPASFAPALARVMGLSQPRQGTHLAKGLLVTDLSVTYVFPQYTNLPDLTLDNVSGELHALRGTEVRLKASLSQDADEARLVLRGSDLRPLSLKDERIEGALVLMESGSYRFALRRSGSAWLEEPFDRDMVVEEDSLPDVELEEPEDDLMVNEAQTIPMRFSVTDDFGVTELAVVVTFEGAGERSRRFPLRRLSWPESTLQGEDVLELAPLDLQPGDRFSFHIEALDNDVVSGPKAGLSRSVQVTVFSARQKHQESMVLQEQLLEGLIDLLDARLTLPDPGQGNLRPLAEAQDKADGLLNTFREVESSLATDPLVPDKVKERLAALRGEMEALLAEERAVFDLSSSLTRSVVSRLRDLAVRYVVTLEDGVIAVEEMLASQRMDDLLALGEEISRQREKVASLIQQYQKEGGEELRQRIEMEMERLQAKVQEMAKRMAQMAREMPYEHLNAEAMKQLPASSDLESVQEQLQQIKDMLNQGDMEGLMAQMDSLAQQIESLRGAMERGMEAMGMESSQAARVLSGLMDEVTDMSASQHRLLSETGEVERSAQERQGEDPGLSELRSRVAQEVERLRLALDDLPSLSLEGEARSSRDRAQRSLDSLGEQILQGPLAQAMVQAEEALLELREMEASLRQGGEEARDRLDRAQRMIPMAEGIVEDLRQALERSQPPLTQEETKRLGKMAGEQTELKDRAQRARQRLGEMAGEMPGLAEPLQSLLQEAENQMGKASERMKGQAPGQARAHQQAAQQKLGQLRKRLADSMKQGGAMGSRMAGFDDGRNNEVKIPGAEDHKVSERFRRDILDSLKREAPKSYRKQVKGYLESLVR